MKAKSHVGASRYLKADLLGPNRAVTVEILRVDLEKVGDRQKPVMYFVAHERGLPLNVENVNALSEMFGTDETEHWLGKRIELFTTYVQFGGKSVLGIRVRRATTSTGEPQPRRQAAEDHRPGGPLHAADMRW